jgi:HAD superfamily hydrolase (TIGR01509 family)
MTLMQRPPSAVIFDMDGLMLDTESLAARAWEDAAAQMDVAFSAALCRRMIGRNGASCRELLATHYGRAFPIERLMNAWNAAYTTLVRSEGVDVKTGLSELLDLLEAMNIPKAVATSSGHVGATAKLDRANLLHRFSVLVGGDQVTHGKPAPDIFLEAAARLCVAPNGCLVLEDSEPGVAAAWAAGMTPIMVPDLHLPSDELMARELVVMSSLHDVCAHLKATSAHG